MSQWQRRVVEFPEREDLTRLAPGSKIVWIEREIVACPSCKRPGAAIKDSTGEVAIVVHVTDANRDLHEACFRDVPEGAPDVVVVDPDGKPITVIHTTEKKVAGEN